MQRNRLIRVTGVAFLTATLALGAAGRADACSCIAQSPEEALTRAGLVAEVTVEKVRVTARYGYGGKLQATVRLGTVYKGPARAGERLTLEGADNSAACGIVFGEGESYLLLAYLDEAGEWQTDLCSGTARLEHAGPLVAAARALPPAEEGGAPPDDRVDEESEAGGCWFGWGD